jgi:hypothetical protein
MSETLFKEVRYTLGGLVNGVSMGQIGLPDIQRPFVWSKRDRKNKHHPLRSFKRRFSPLEAGLSPCLVGLRRFGAGGWLEA